MTASLLRSFALVAALTSILAHPGHAQDDEDVKQIRQVIAVYFRGHATANADTMRAAFLPTAHIEGIRNGAFTSWTVDQYVANFRRYAGPGRVEPHAHHRRRRQDRHGSDGQSHPRARRDHVHGLFRPAQIGRKVAHREQGISRAAIGFLLHHRAARSSLHRCPLLPLVSRWPSDEPDHPWPRTSRRRLDRRGTPHRCRMRSSNEPLRTSRGTLPPLAAVCAAPRSGCRAGTAGAPVLLPSYRASAGPAPLVTTRICFPSASVGFWHYRASSRRDIEDCLKYGP